MGTNKYGIDDDWWKQEGVYDKLPTAEIALFAANEVERNLKWWQRRSFNFQVEYVRQYALAVAEKARRG